MVSGRGALDDRVSREARRDFFCLGVEGNGWRNRLSRIRRVRL